MILAGACAPDPEAVAVPASPAGPQNLQPAPVPGNRRDVFDAAPPSRRENTAMPRMRLEGAVPRETRTPHGWPDRFSGEPAGAPVRPSF